MTTRLGAQLCSRGSSSWVSRKWPRWFTWKGRLKPSSVVPPALTPAEGEPAVGAARARWGGGIGQGAPVLTRVVDEEVQVRLLLQEGAGEGAHRAQAGQVQVHEPHLRVPRLLRAQQRLGQRPGWGHPARGGGWIWPGVKGG